VVEEIVSVEISVVDSSVEIEVDSVEDVVQSSLGEVSYELLDVGSKDVEMEDIKSEVVLNGVVSVVPTSEDSVLGSV
jgi:hypothetical protein